LFDAGKIDDGMAAHAVRLGAEQQALGPGQKLAGGYYVVVANGSLVTDGRELPLWSMVVAASNFDFAIAKKR
jgi:hypothetical protein